jgi:hypothetical protein
MKNSDKIFLTLITIALAYAMLPAAFSLGEGCNSSADNCTTICEFCNATTSVCEISPATMDNKSECSAFSCNTTYLVNNLTGLCNGTTAVCNTTPISIANVSIGKVCANGTNYSTAPTSSVYCSIWNNCVANATSYSSYYVGYQGNGATTCNETSWVLQSSVTLPSNYKVLSTLNTSSACSITSNKVDDATYSGITGTKTLVFAGLALIAVMILVTIAWGLIKIFQGGVQMDFMAVTIAAIGGAVLIMLGFIIIYFIANGLGA